MSWVVSLGAGAEQIPLIRAIQHEHHKCVAFDIDPKAAGKDIADLFYPISNRDVDAIQAACEYVGVAGVMVAASEAPDVAAILQDHLGLPGNSAKVGLLLKDKLAYKKVLLAAGVPHTEAHVVYEGSEKALFDKLRYQVVVKPQRGSGSRGVTCLINDPMALSIAVMDAQAVCFDVLMERYQPGPQISTETVVWDGRAVTVAFIDRFYDKREGSRALRERGGSTPSFWESERERAHDVIVSAAKALGVRRGTIKCDLVLTDAGPKIIECTSRLSGGPLSSIVKRHSGVDYLRQAVKIAVGEEPFWQALMPIREEPVCVDMAGNNMPWEKRMDYIQTELGKCAS